MKLIFAFLLLVASCFGQDKADIAYIHDILYPATTLLYAQDESGGMKMRCTATAIEKNATGYVFVTAAHCACEDNEEQKTVSPEKVDFYITEDGVTDKEFLKASLTGCGYRHGGDDFALFQMNTTKVFPVVALGRDPQMIEQVVNVASPLGLGRQVFFGSVSSPILNRPVINDDINWEGAVLLQMFGVNGGSSGSSVVCLDQKAICAFVVGAIGQTTMTAMPVSRLIKLRSQLAAGTYKHWQADPDAPISKTETKAKK